MEQIRLFFEPKKGTNVNHSEMFKYYINNYLDGFNGYYSGFIAMDAGEKVIGEFEPVYQYIIDDPSDACSAYLMEYLERNPLAGYYVHIYNKNVNKNLKNIKYFG